MALPKYTATGWGSGTFAFGSGVGRLVLNTAAPTDCMDVRRPACRPGGSKPFLSHVGPRQFRLMWLSGGGRRGRVERDFRRSFRRR